MGPFEIIPAAVERRIPLLPDPWPRNLTICGGFKNRFIKTISMITRLKGSMRLSKSPMLLPNAMAALAGLNTKTIA
jgi:hypothetical protein